MFSLLICSITCVIYFLDVIYSNWHHARQFHVSSDTEYFVFWFFFFFRGGVLEPEGTVEIKFRKKDQVVLMRRIDPECRSIVDKMAASNLTKEDKTSKN